DVHHLAMALRACRDYLQFAGPQYNDSYRARAEERVPPPFQRLADSRPGRIRFVRRVLRALVPAAERLLPPSDVARRYLASHAPDVVAFTPYVGLRTVQPDFLKAAQALGLPTAVFVASWDNLSSKSLLRPVPDLVTVWNETQRTEAAQLHGIDAARVVVTGAQCFDHWFGWPARPREEFCARAGLDPQRPYLLYTCFSPFKGQNSEPAFVRRWLEQLRAHPDAVLRDIGVLVRPHPKRGAQWRGVDLSGFGNVAVWPSEGAMVLADSARADFYDSIFHSVAVVGLNTSAMIEAGIVGRPVHTLLVPEYWESQEGTLHFRYLAEVGGGLLQIARTWGEHLAQLAASAGSAGGAHAPARTFVESFVRPHGLGVAASPVFADAVVRLAVRPTAASPRSERGQRLQYVLVGPIARRAAAARDREAGRRKTGRKVVS
ncbi:MAG: hypothetical protein M3545_20200, partial [Acidobacteriota bacterium]|nr:hypothetical protein [Acidobacteriota bacterium]